MGSAVSALSGEPVGRDMKAQAEMLVAGLAELHGQLQQHFDQETWNAAQARALANTLRQLTLTADRVAVAAAKEEVLRMQASAPPEVVVPKAKEVRVAKKTTPERKQRHSSSSPLLAAAAARKAEPWESEDFAMSDPVPYSTRARMEKKTREPKVPPPRVPTSALVAVANEEASAMQALAMPGSMKTDVAHARGKEAWIGGPARSERRNADGTTVDEAKMDKRVAEAVTPAASLQEAPQSGWDEMKPYFYFLPRSFVLKSIVQGLPRMQELKSELVRKQVNLGAALRGIGLADTLVVSHRWDMPTLPDRYGAQLRRIQQYLKEHEHIQYVWYDFWCTPQISDERSVGDDRTDDEKEECQLTRSAIADLFLVTPHVLILLAPDSSGRFWQMLECWCAMQTASPAGLLPSTRKSERYEMTGSDEVTASLEGFDPYEAAIELKELLWRKSAPEMQDMLARADFVAANAQDKDEVLPIVGRANERIMQIYAETTDLVDPTNLRLAGFNASQLKASRFDATQLKVAGFDASELTVAEFTLSEMKVAGYSAAQVLLAGHDASDMKKARFKATEMRAAGLNAVQLKAAGYDAVQLKSAGFYLLHLQDAGFTGAQLLTAGFNETAVNFGVKGNHVAQLKAAGIDSDDLKTAGSALRKIVTFGSYEVAMARGSINRTSTHHPRL